MRYPGRDNVIPNHDSRTVDGEFDKNPGALEHAYLAGEYNGWPFERPLVVDSVSARTTHSNRRETVSIPR